MSCIALSRMVVAASSVVVHPQAAVSEPNRHQWRLGTVPAVVVVAVRPQARVAWVVPLVEDQQMDLTYPSA